jgi:hypothetical protein
MKTKIMSKLGKSVAGDTVKTVTKAVAKKKERQIKLIAGLMLFTFVVLIFFAKSESQPVQRFIEILLNTLERVLP